MAGENNDFDQRLLNEYESLINRVFELKKRQENARIKVNEHKQILSRQKDKFEKLKYEYKKTKQLFIIKFGRFEISFNGLSLSVSVKRNVSTVYNQISNVLSSENVSTQNIGENQQQPILPANKEMDNSEKIEIALLALKFNDSDQLLMESESLKKEINELEEILTNAENTTKENTETLSSIEADLLELENTLNELKKLLQPFVFKFGFGHLEIYFNIYAIYERLANLIRLFFPIAVFFVFLLRVPVSLFGWHYFFIIE